MLELITNAIREQFQNQLVAGGLVLGLMGLILASLRNLLQQQGTDHGFLLDPSDELLKLNKPRLSFFEQLNIRSPQKLPSVVAKPFQV